MKINIADMNLSAVVQTWLRELDPDPDLDCGSSIFWLNLDFLMDPDPQIQVIWSFNQYPMSFQGIWTVILFLIHQGVQLMDYLSRTWMQFLKKLLECALLWYNLLLCCVAFLLWHVKILFKIYCFGVKSSNLILFATKFTGVSLPKSQVSASMVRGSILWPIFSSLQILWCNSYFWRWILPNKFIWDKICPTLIAYNFRNSGRI